jgi:hypothetical protein
MLTKGAEKEHVLSQQIDIHIVSTAALGTDNPEYLSHNLLLLSITFPSEP